MCVSKFQHVTGRKTGCNRSRPVFFGFSIFRQTSQLATEKIQNLGNRNRWSGLLRLGSVRFRSFFQSSELDLRTLSARLSTSQAPATTLEIAKMRDVPYLEAVGSLMYTSLEPVLTYCLQFKPSLVSPRTLVSHIG